jgi:hypothetical protein
MGSKYDQTTYTYEYVVCTYICINDTKKSIFCQLIWLFFNIERALKMSK